MFISYKNYQNNHGLVVNMVYVLYVHYGVVARLLLGVHAKLCFTCHVSIGAMSETQTLFLPPAPLTRDQCPLDQ